LKKQATKKELTEKFLGGGSVKADDAASRRTNLSKRSLSKSDLNKFFSEKKKEVEDEVKSRISQISKGSRASGVSGFKAKFMKKIEEQNENAKKDREQAITQAITAAIEEHTYESDQDIINNPDCKEEKAEVPPQAEDAMTVASSAIEQLSVTPTEQLAREYKQLLEQYDSELNKRMELEKEVERLKSESGIN
jgi:hypothetical protein